MTECLGCNLIETAPVTLINGTTVCTSCPAWMQQCEAAHILSLPTVWARRQWLSAIEGKAGGVERAKALRETMTALHKARRAA